MLIVKKSCKDFGKELGVRFPDSALEKLDEQVKELIRDASERSKANGRVTIKGYDL